MTKCPKSVFHSRHCRLDASRSLSDVWVFAVSPLDRVWGRVDPQVAQVCPCPFLLHTPAEEENHMGWFCVEDDGNQIKKERHPLLVGHMPVTVAKQQEFKVMDGGPGGRVHCA